MQKLPSLQVLRAVAALGVAASHIWGAPLFHLTAGVDLFFVVSGFVMVSSSTNLFGGQNSALFFGRRILRIVPLYWATVAVILYLGAPATREEIFKTLFFIPYVNTAGNWQPIGFVGWTLNYEMFFYAIFAATIVLPRRAAVAAAVVLIAVLVAIGGTVRTTGLALFYTNPIIIEFAFGCVLGLAYVEGWRLPRAVAVAMIVIAIAVFSYVDAPYDAAGTALGYARPFVWGLPAAAAVAGACLVKRPWTVGEVGAPLYLLGDASYALYLTHMQLYGFMMQWGYSRTIAFWVVIAFAMAVHLCFERPIQWLTKAKRPAASALPAELPGGLSLSGSLSLNREQG